MSDPIDIKTKKNIPQFTIHKFDKALVLDELEKNILTHWDTWGRFQQIWCNQAFNTFKDFDKYLVLIYLIRDYLQSISDKFNYYSYDDFYKSNILSIDKLNLIKISNELNVPKETIRRKINELQKSKIIRREGKSIILENDLMVIQKPENSLDALSGLINKKSKFLQGESWFGSGIEKEEIKIYIKKYFTVLWLRFLKLQIPFLLRHRSNFKDLETWMIWGNIAINHQSNLKKIESNLVEHRHFDYTNYYQKVSDLKIERGVNASSIADISGIPRATVIRKLNWLVDQQAIKKNKKLEYTLQYKGRLNKKIEQNFKVNQTYLAEFLTDFFDYYKNSNFKP